MMDRRGFLLGSMAGAGALRAGVAGVGGAMTLGGAAWAQEPAVHRFKFGEFDVTVLSDGVLNLPVSALAQDMDLKTVQDLLAERGLPTDMRPGAINVALLTRGSDTILVDTGSGMNFMDSAGKLVDSLEIAQVAPDSITKVVLTHAHPDHCWGVIDDFDDSPRFSEADYTIAAAEFDFWMAEDRVDQLPDPVKPFALGAQRNLAPVAERTTMAADGHEVVPGVTMIATPGHTPGHMSVLVQSGGEQLLVTGDAFTHDVIAFEYPDWHFGFDMDHVQAAATRGKLLKRIAGDNIRLLGYHLTRPGVGRVEAAGSGYRYVAEA